MNATFDKLWMRENAVADFIPYAAHITPTVIKTKSGDYVGIIKLSGVAHESADPEDITIWKDQINGVLQTIASPQVSVWTHVIRHHAANTLKGIYPQGFASDLHQKYQHALSRKEMLINELYISIIYRPDATDSAKKIRTFCKAKVSKVRAQKALLAMEEVMELVLSGLERYRPSVLGTYSRSHTVYSSALEFLDFLVNGSWHARPLPKKPLDEALPRVRPFFYKDRLELAGMADSQAAAMVGIAEYPEVTEAGLLNALLSAPFPFVLTQSFVFLSKPSALSALKRQQRILDNTGDVAISQIAAIDEALDDLGSNRLVYGEHHLSLTVYASDPDRLKENLSQAAKYLADSSIITVREDWALASAFWAQLPGNAKYRPRPVLVSSRNFAGFSSFHNYPVGQKEGNQWGEAVTLFKTSSGAPYYFNFHEPQQTTEQSYAGHTALGNTLIIGPSGSGKTVLQGFLLSSSIKYEPTQVIFDKDRGLEIFVRASGGMYLPLAAGKPTGFNPFQLPASEETLLFLEDLVTKLCGENLSYRQREDITASVRGVMGLKSSSRRLSRCLEFFPIGSELHSRLGRWCGDQPLAWVFDNAKDSMDLSHGTLFGFDVTDFLDMPEVRTPLVMYLFHRIESLIDGRRFMLFMDEFWKLLRDDYFEDFAQNKQKVIRKQNGIMVYGTQSARDILDSDIAHTLVEQCATMILLPNPKAQAEEYMGGLHLSQREYQLIREDLQPNSRQFLIKQGHTSVVAELNLKGFVEELAVISGTTDSVRLLYKIMAEHGENPHVWLPVFYKAHGEKLCSSAS